MSDIGEGIGTMAEGSLFSRALEPDSGAGERQADDPKACLNCRTPLVGAYCHACGQPAHIHRTLHAFWHELLHGALHFEGKFWRTLPMLVLRPGQLTRRYIEGARARFVSPMALFLFSVFLMFAVFQILGAASPTSIEGPQIDTVRADLAERRAELERRQTALAQRAEAAETPAERARIAAERAEVADEMDGVTTGEALFGSNLQNGRGSDITTRLNASWLDKLAHKWRDNPGLMLYKLQANSYKFSWLLIPISIPFVWLLFAWKRRFKAYDHAIFVTYSLSFMTLLFVTASLLEAIGTPWPALAALILLVPPMHVYKQMRGTYELGRFSAIWRLLVLSIFIWIVLALFIQLLLLLGSI